MSGIVPSARSPMANVAKVGDRNYLQSRPSARFIVCQEISAFPVSSLSDASSVLTCPYKFSPDVIRYLAVGRQVLAAMPARGLFAAQSARPLRCSASAAARLRSHHPSARRSAKEGAVGPAALGRGRGAGNACLPSSWSKSISRHHLSRSILCSSSNLCRLYEGWMVSSRGRRAA
jgi:hypothetical protein